MTSADTQISMALALEGADAPDKIWLGLITEHRRLFDALQDGWLHPLPPDTGTLLGIEKYAKEENAVQEGHPIEIRLKLNPRKLPDLEVAACRGGEWKTRSIRTVESSDTALYWPGVFPTFAIQDIAVSSEEERVRLNGMARFASNLILDEDAVRVDTGSEETIVADACPPQTGSGLAIPKHGDAVHGAMSMAVWAVPRIDPWLELLVASLASDRARLPELAEGVDASWGRFPPWVASPECAKPTGVEECLWLAAVDTLSTRSVEDHGAPRALADRIAETAPRYGRPENMAAISGWIQNTHRILRGKSIIQLDEWRTCPVGKAIQLVLNRPDPLKFKTWFQDLPDLPPAIAWSAATLCGLLHGYRRLDARFRGDAFQRELLSILALRACADDARALDWPSLGSEDPRWRRESGNFILSWGTEDFARRPEKARGKWYAANFDDEATWREALALAKVRKWHCMNRDVVLRDTRLEYSGSGTVHPLDEGAPQIEIKGEVRLRMPPGSSFEERFDAGPV